MVIYDLLYNQWCTSWSYTQCYACMLIGMVCMGNCHVYTHSYNYCKLNLMGFPTILRGLELDRYLARYIAIACVIDRHPQLLDMQYQWLTLKHNNYTNYNTFEIKKSICICTAICRAQTSDSSCNIVMQVTCSYTFVHKMQLIIILWQDYEKSMKFLTPLTIVRPVPFYCSS